MFKKLHLLATARRLNNFTVEELADAADMPVRGVRAVIGRLPSHWYAEESPTSGGRGSVRFTLSKVGEAAIDSQLERRLDNPYEDYVDADYDARTSFLAEERLKLAEEYASSEPELSSHFLGQSILGMTFRPSVTNEARPGAAYRFADAQVAQKYKLSPADLKLVREANAMTRVRREAKTLLPLESTPYHVPIHFYSKHTSDAHSRFLTTSEPTVSGSYPSKNVKVERLSKSLLHSGGSLTGSYLSDFDFPFVEVRQELDYRIERARENLLSVLLVSLDHHGSTVKLAKIAEQCAEMAGELGREPIRVQTIEFDRLQSPAFFTALRGQFDKIILCGNSSQREAQRKASKIIRSSLLNWISVHFIDAVHNSAFEESIKSSAMHYSPVSDGKVFRAVLDAMTAKQASTATPQIGWEAE